VGRVQWVQTAYPSGRAASTWISAQKAAKREIQALNAVLEAPITRAAGMNAHLSKPISLEQLQAVLRHYLALGPEATA
jgi:CheY-like chemotaxis protein